MTNVHITYASLLLASIYSTVWKFQSFSAIQILHNQVWGFKKLKKNAISAVLLALDFHLANFTCENLRKNCIKFKLQRIYKCQNGGS